MTLAPSGSLTMKSFTPGGGVPAAASSCAALAAAASMSVRADLAASRSLRAVAMSRAASAAVVGAFGSAGAPGFGAGSCAGCADSLTGRGGSLTAVRGVFRTLGVRFTGAGGATDTAAGARGGPDCAGGGTGAGWTAGAGFNAVPLGAEAGAGGSGACFCRGTNRTMTTTPATSAPTVRSRRTGANAQSPKRVTRASSGARSPAKVPVSGSPGRAGSVSGICPGSRGAGSGSAGGSSAESPRSRRQPRRASCNSAIDCQRSSFFFSSALRMIFSYASGTDGSIERGAGAFDCICKTSVSAVLAPANGTRPVASWNMTTPSA